MNAEIVIRGMIENATRGRWNFISLKDATELTRKWSRRLPRHYDLIVGVPRAGMLFGAMLANSLGVKLTAPGSLETWNPPGDGKEVNDILVVEDAITTGSRLKPARDWANIAYPEASVDIGSLYVDKDAIEVDTFGDVLPNHPLIEWDLLDLDPSMKIAADMDGVLCEDCPRYMEPDFDLWIPTAKPFMLPRYPLHAIITSRYSCYEPMTVQWLRRNGVQYKTLAMDPTPIGGKRDLVGHKVNQVYRLKPRLIFESSDFVAFKIYWRTSVPTLAFDTMRFFGGDNPYYQ